MNESKALNSALPEKDPHQKISARRIDKEVLEKAPEDFKKTLKLINEFLDEFRIEKKDRQRIAVVISAYDACDVLPQTIKELTEQIQAAGLKGEIFVIYNNGGGNTTQFLNAETTQETIEQERTNLGVSEIIFGQTKPIEKDQYNGQDTRVIPRDIDIGKANLSEKNGVRLVVIQQDKDPDNPGKIRALRDLYSFLLKLNKETGYFPAFLLAADAETRLRLIDSKTGKISFDTDQALSSLISLLNKGYSFVGAANLLTPYKAGNPDFSQLPPPIQAVINIIHGKKGFEWLPGGATLGSFDEMASILAAISQTLPGVRVEDVLTTIVGRLLGEQIIIKNIVHTNRCPDDREKALDQILRWIQGLEGLKSLTGEELFKEIMKFQSLERIIGYCVFETVNSIARKIKKSQSSITNPFYLLQGLIPYLGIISEAKKNQDNLISGQANW